MEEYELRPVEGNLELSGGKLEETLRYPSDDRAAAVRLVGFLSQRTGSILRVFDAVGHEVETQRREATVVLDRAGNSTVLRGLCAVVPKP